MKILYTCILIVLTFQYISGSDSDENYSQTNLLDELFMNEALLEAQIGLSQGGIPIGSVIVVDGKIVGRGHNQRMQKGSAILHGEMDALENAGRLSPDVYRRATLYTTLSPCSMCTGAILLYRIGRVVIGDNINHNSGTIGEDLLRNEGVEVKVLNNPRCIKLMKDYIENHPQIWEEDAGICVDCKKNSTISEDHVYRNFNYNLQLLKKNASLSAPTVNSQSKKLKNPQELQTFRQNTSLIFSLALLIFAILVYLSIKLLEMEKQNCESDVELNSYYINN